MNTKSFFRTKSFFAIARQESENIFSSLLLFYAKMLFLHFSSAFSLILILRSATGVFV